MRVACVVVLQIVSSQEGLGILCPCAFCHDLNPQYKSLQCDPETVDRHMVSEVRDKILTLKVLIMTIDALGHFKQDTDSTVGGDGGCRVGEVRASTTSPMPDHKGFKLQ